MEKTRPGILSVTTIAAAVAAGMFVTWFPLTNSDIWWHLAAGREMAARGSILFEDPFSYSIENSQWTDLHWLFQLMVYAVYRMGGAGGLVWTKLLFTGTAVLLLCLVRKDKWYRFGILVMGTFFLFRVRYLVLMRPVIITMVFMAAQIYLFEKFRREKKRGVLWFLLPIQLIWVNSQGLFILGVGIAGAYWLEGLYESLRNKEYYLLKQMSMALAGIVLCSFINPWGFRGALFPYSLFERINPVAQKIYSMNISENTPLMALSGNDAHYRGTFFILILWLAAAYIIDRKNCRISHICITTGLLYLGFCAKRNILTALIGTLPFGVYHSVDGAGAVIKRLTDRNRIKAAFAGAGAGIVAVIILLQYRITGYYPQGSHISPFRYPQNAVNWIKEREIDGKIFQSIRYGGYFIWELYPQKKVFIDGRLIIRPPDFLAEYLLVCRQPSLFKIVSEKHGVSVVALPVVFPDRYRGLIRWLYDSDEWGLAFTDGSSVVFVNSQEEETASVDLSSRSQAEEIIRNINTRWKGQPHIKREALEHLRQLLIILSIDTDVIKEYNETV